MGGIEVFGTEWSFGPAEEDRSGVFCLAPRSHTEHTYRTTVPLGETGMSMQEAREVAERLSGQGQWKGNEYHSICNSCLNFANHFCRELGVREIPGWVDRIPHTASTVATTLGEVEGTILDALPDDELVGQLADTVLDASPDDETVGQIAEDLSKNAEAAAAAVLGEDLTAKAKQVGEAFTSSLWKAARSVSQDLQEATGAPVEDPAPPGTHAAASAAVSGDANAQE